MAQAKWAQLWWARGMDLEEFRLILNWAANVGIAFMAILALSTRKNISIIGNYRIWNICDHQHDKNGKTRRGNCKLLVIAI